MDEYIERRRLFNALADYWKIPLDWDGGIAQPCEDALAFIENAPEEDVAPVVHGRWFDTGVENETGSIYFCSACNKYNNPNKKDVKMRRAKEKPDYCPNCGAKMDGEGK